MIIEAAAAILLVSGQPATCEWMTTDAAVAEYTPADEYDRGLYPWRAFPEWLSRDYSGGEADKVTLRPDDAGERVVIIFSRKGCVVSIQEMGLFQHNVQLERVLGIKCLDKSLRWC